MSLSRQLRRAAERAQHKQERKALKNSLSGTDAAERKHTGEENVLKNSVTDLSAVARTEVCNEADAGAAVCPRFFSPEPSPTAEPKPNRTGAGGPRTPEGKAISSLNNLKHGLTGKFRVLESESQSDFDAAHDALIAEHEPATPTESELIRRMAEHAWLSRRAQTLQDKALMDGDDKRFSLYMRYQTTNDRGFRACLNDLFKLRREQRKTSRSGQGVRGPLCADQERFESQNREAELHDARVRLANARAAHLELDTDIRSYVDAPIPGYSSIPLEQVKELFQSAILSLKPLKGAQTAA